MKAIVGFVLVGVGAMNSPRYAPAGLLVKYKNQRIMLDGPPESDPKCELNDWLVTDDRGELIGKIRKAASARDLTPRVGSYQSGNLTIKPRKVVHTSHPSFAYQITVGKKKIVWAPEFFKFPHWIKNVDLMFAEAAGWKRAIYFRG